MHVAIIKIFETLISFQLKDNGNLPHNLEYPSINEHDQEDERKYDLIFFSGHRVMKDNIETHNHLSECYKYFDVKTGDFPVSVDYYHNFCGKKTCTLSTLVSKYRVSQ